MLLKLIRISMVIGMILMCIVAIFYYSQAEGRIAIATLGICELVLYFTQEILSEYEES